MNYLEETANNIILSILLEMTTDGDKGGGGDEGTGGGDSGHPLSLDPYASDPYYNPSGREIDIDSPEGFFDVDWDSPGGRGFGKGFPERGPEEPYHEYEERVRQFYRDLYRRIPNDERIFPFGNTDNLIPNPYGKTPPLIPDPSREAAPGYIEDGGLQSDITPFLLPMGPGFGNLLGRFVKSPFGRETIIDTGVGLGLDMIPGGGPGRDPSLYGPLDGYRPPSQQRPMPGLFGKPVPNPADRLYYPTLFPDSNTGSGY